MLKPKEISIIDIDGLERNFIISRFPATVGMEIFYRLPMSAVPKIGDFEALKDVRNDIFKYVYLEPTQAVVLKCRNFIARFDSPQLEPTQAVVLKYAGRR